MARVKHEFYCTNCYKYFDVKLNMSLEGNHRVHCPNCDHVHYRTVSKGKITDTRFTRNDCPILVDDIYPMKASCRDFQKEKVEDVADTEAGFMRRLWSEKFAARVQDENHTPQKV